MGSTIVANAWRLQRRWTSFQIILVEACYLRTCCTTSCPILSTKPM
jgi:hypothetical protein